MRRRRKNKHKEKSSHQRKLNSSMYSNSLKRPTMKPSRITHSFLLSTTHQLVDIVFNLLPTMIFSQRKWRVRNPNMLLQLSIWLATRISMTMSVSTDTLLSDSTLMATNSTTREREMARRSRSGWIKLSTPDFPRPNLLSPSRNLPLLSSALLTIVLSKD